LVRDHGPKISIAIGARIKKPGTEQGSIPTELMAVRDGGAVEVDAYERLLTDASFYRRQSRDSSTRSRRFLARLKLSGFERILRRLAATRPPRAR